MRFLSASIFLASSNVFKSLSVRQSLSDAAAIESLLAMVKLQNR
jgi:hypothetical protein